MGRGEGTDVAVGPGVAVESAWAGGAGGRMRAGVKDVGVAVLVGEGVAVAVEVEVGDGVLEGIAVEVAVAGVVGVAVNVFVGTGVVVGAAAKMKSTCPMPWHGPVAVFSLMTVTKEVPTPVTE